MNIKRPNPPKLTADIPAADTRPGYLPTTFGRLLRRAGIGLALVTLVAVVLIAFMRQAHTGRIYPGVTIAGTSVSGLTPDEAAASLAAPLASMASAPVTLTFGDQVWTSTYGELGFSFDSAAAVARAYAIGREATALTRLTGEVGRLRTDVALPLPLRLDETQLNAWLDQIDADLNRLPQEAGLELSATGVTVLPDQDGLLADRAAIRGELLTAVARVLPVRAALPTQVVTPRVRAADLAPAQAVLQRTYTTPLSVTFADRTWPVSGVDLAPFVTQRIDPNLRGAPAFSLALDQGKLASWLETTLAPEINQQPKDGALGWNGQQVVTVEPSRDGATLDSVALAEALATSLFGTQSAVAAPVAVTHPTIDGDRLETLGIARELARGTSNYSGSIDGRANNIQVGVQLLNGTLVPPGGEFSFNNAIGYITREKGYQDAQVILGEAIGQDIGGGICQVSTTVFRAAYLAGFPMTEWWPHRFRIGFYEYDGWPPGLDASILQPTEDPTTWADYRFENPTDSWLLVESWADGVNVTVVIYGPDTGWSVETDGPTVGDRFQVLPDKEVVDGTLDAGTVKQSSTASIGEEFSHYRAVKDRAGNLLWERSFYTKFFPQGNTWSVSPDMVGKSPAQPNRALPPLPPREPTAP